MLESKALSFSTVDYGGLRYRKGGKTNAKAS
jgi:hypothetical protein